MALYAQVTQLSETLYTDSRDSQKRRAFEQIIRETSEERGAWMNCDIPCPLSFILPSAMVNDVKERLRLDKRINVLDESLKSLDQRLRLPQFVISY